MQDPTETDDAANASRVVLVVDDAGFARRQVRKAVEELGFDVIEATTAEDAVTWLETCPDEQRPCGILLDIIMPGMGGMALLQKLRRDRTFDDVRIVMVSANKASWRLDECLVGGADAFVAKPLRQTALVEALVDVGLLSFAEGSAILEAAAGSDTVAAG